MAKTVSVVIPVKDGEERLEEVLAAVVSQGAPELIVIDSGSRDRSREIARAAGAEVIEIPPEDFGHGRTRNLGAERSSGELICFLTQDAVPVDGWLDAYREAFTLDERAGAAFGPHLPHPDTSPMIARELTEFFQGFAPNGQPGASPERRSNLPLERERVLHAGVLGGAAVPGRGVLGGSGLRVSDARGGMGEGLPSGGSRAARARLRRARLLPALLRRVPRAPRDERARGAARSPSRPPGRS